MEKPRAHPKSLKDKRHAPPQPGCTARTELSTHITSGRAAGSKPDRARHRPEVFTYPKHVTKFAYCYPGSGAVNALVVPSPHRAEDQEISSHSTGEFRDAASANTEIKPVVAYMLSGSSHRINQTLRSATENGSRTRWPHSTLRLVGIQCGRVLMQNMLITLFWRDLSLLFRKEEKKASFKPREDTVARTCKGVTLLSVLGSPLSCSASVCAPGNPVPNRQTDSSE